MNGPAYDASPRPADGEFKIHEKPQSTNTRDSAGSRQAGYQPDLEIRRLRLYT